MIRALHMKKHRDRHGIYLAEGDKLVGELIRADYSGAHQIIRIYATGDWIGRHRPLLEISACPLSEVTPAEMKKLSSLITPPGVLAMVSKPESQTSWESLRHEPLLGFESIRDPGNLGTIIRSADWFGFRHLVCTPDSVDLYNPKVVQATMGAITRIQVHVTDIGALTELPELSGKPVYGTFPEGEDIYHIRWENAPLILFGNESTGLSASLSRYIKKRISIPAFSKGKHGSESLNVASSAAVVCSEYRRAGQLPGATRSGN